MGPEPRGYSFQAYSEQADAREADRPGLSDTIRLHWRQLLKPKSEQRVTVNRAIPDVSPAPTATPFAAAVLT